MGEEIGEGWIEQGSKKKKPPVERIRKVVQVKMVRGDVVGKPACTG